MKVNLFYNWSQFQLKTFTIYSVYCKKRTKERKDNEKKTRNWQVRSCFQCPVHSLCPPLSISSPPPPEIVLTLFDTGKSRKSFAYDLFTNLSKPDRLSESDYLQFSQKKVSMVIQLSKCNKKHKGIRVSPSRPCLCQIRLKRAVY